MTLLNKWIPDNIHPSIKYYVADIRYKIFNISLKIYKQLLYKKVFYKIQSKMWYMYTIIFTI